MIWTISSDPPTQLDDNLVYTTIFKAVLLVKTTDLDFWKNQITMIISLQFVSPINLIMGADRLHEDNLKYYFLKVQKPVLEFFLDYGGITFFWMQFYTIHIGLFRKERLMLDEIFLQNAQRCTSMK